MMYYAPDTQANFQSEYGSEMGEAGIGLMPIMIGSGMNTASELWTETAKNGKNIYDFSLYDEKIISYYFYDEWNEHLPYKAKMSPILKLMNELDFTIDHSKSPEKVMVSAVFYIILALFEIAKQVKDFIIADARLRHEVRNINDYISEYRFLKAEKLDTMKDIKEYIDATKAEITELEHIRTIADNKRRRASPEDQHKYKQERKAITEHITPLRRKLKKAERI